MKFKLDFDINEASHVEPTEADDIVITKIIDDLEEAENAFGIAIDNAPNDRIRFFLAIQGGISLSRLVKENVSAIVFLPVIADRYLLSYFGFSYNELIEKLETADTDRIEEIAGTKEEFFCMLYVSAFSDTLKS